MMVEMIDAFVAKFAVHRLLTNLDVANPALFGGLIRIPNWSTNGVIVWVVWILRVVRVVHVM